MLTKENKKTVEIQIEDVTLQGNLAIPENATAIVIFSHGSGSSRLSPRNNYVAEVLQQEGLATLLSDLLTEKEDRIYENRFNIDLLTERLIAITKWVKENPETKGLNLGYFGASTGAASALVAAAYFGNEIKVVVSRGGRPDLGMQDIQKVKAPTLLIVGGYDDLVIQLNQKAFEKLQCERKLEIVPEASHLFEEPGKLNVVARLSADWFSKWI
ncbi:MAG TPA: dienelactone hydrolase family protein [Gillisia sp.]|nr:dienelactone hydrolase family protein [Gillisia sp.]